MALRAEKGNVDFLEYFVGYHFYKLEQSL